VECLVIFLILVGALVAITFSLASSSGSVNTAYIKLAKHFHGKVRSGGWFSYSRLVFKYGSTEARLQTRRRNGRVVTELVIDWPPVDYWCRILSDKLDVKAPRRLREILPASQRCAPYFRVFSNDAESTQLMITETVQWQLRNLAHNSFGRELLIEMAFDRILFQMDGYVWRYDTIKGFIQAALEFYDQAMLTRCEGIEFVSESELTTLADGKCSVCGEKAIGDLVFCGRCKTPHHRECWHYNAMCAIYGCGETNFVVPEIAKRVDPPHRQLLPKNEFPKLEKGAELALAKSAGSELAHGESAIDETLCSDLSVDSSPDSETTGNSGDQHTTLDGSSTDDSSTDETSTDSALGDVAM
jgi:hypothetical protein